MRLFVPNGLSPVRTWLCETRLLARIIHTNQNRQRGVKPVFLAEAPSRGGVLVIAGHLAQNTAFTNPQPNSATLPCQTRLAQNRPSNLCSYCSVIRSAAIRRNT